MPICLDALVEIFLYCPNCISVVVVVPPPTSSASTYPPPDTSTHQLNGGLWSAHSVYISSRAKHRAKSVHVCDLRQTPGQVELKEPPHIPLM